MVRRRRPRRGLTQPEAVASRRAQKRSFWNSSRRKVSIFEALSSVRTWAATASHSAIVTLRHTRLISGMEFGGTLSSRSPKPNNNIV